MKSILKNSSFRGQGQDSEQDIIQAKVNILHQLSDNNVSSIYESCF